MIANVLNWTLEATSSIDEHGIAYIMLTLATTFRRNKLPNLKWFSLKSYFRFQYYDLIPSLLRRMPYLENLTLYLCIEGRNRIIDVHMYIDIRDLSLNLSREHIQQTLINVGQHNTATIVNYLSTYTVECSIFSLPFVFDFVRPLDNIFPDIVFNYVTYLLVQDNDAFKHEFFVRIARSFPLLKYLRISNIDPQISAYMKLTSNHIQ
ncbi:unnamed protein product [Rotaria magnacalcarata]|uniref:Uncharacterized protein n=2 Tax=Rotaria magnacalcarata TaxID=392030 RepID=A0A814QWZ8_9BILA|nr:unnamed protein product [Rotaria magnacalcarata]CAF3958022.1 unnamed protein product [Rotaria magnacalcarata]